MAGREALAHQAGLVLRNVGLTADLRARLEELRASQQYLVALKIKLFTGGRECRVLLHPRGPPERPEICRCDEGDGPPQRH
jgi:hypothetical protein